MPGAAAPGELPGENCRQLSVISMTGCTACVQPVYLFVFFFFYFYLRVAMYTPQLFGADITFTWNSHEKNTQIYVARCGNGPELSRLIVLNRLLTETAFYPVLNIAHEMSTCNFTFLN